jgi:GPI mannosyltransferase 2
VTLSIICHLLSVLLLHRLSTTIFSKAPQSISSVPVAVAAVHIISPAGAFLSSPYSEALFSSLNILGFQLYLDGLRNHYRRRNHRADIQCLAAGAVFGFATTVRSNGLLSGSLFFYDATVTAISLVNGNFSIEKFRRLIVIGIGGCSIALGAIIPQYRVYASYCILGIGSETRPWCDDYVPSIYAWVQRHYWYEAYTLLVTSDH